MGVVRMGKSNLSFQGVSRIGRVHRLPEVLFRRPVLHEDHLRFLGLITDTEPSNDGGRIKLDVYFENERGERPLQGVAIVLLPSR